MSIVQLLRDLSQSRDSTSSATGQPGLGLNKSNRPAHRLRPCNYSRLLARSHDPGGLKTQNLGADDGRTARQVELLKYIGTVVMQAHREMEQELTG